MKVLITGVMGFLGCSLAKSLLNKGHEVVGVGRRDKLMLDKFLQQATGFSYIKFDLLGDDYNLLNVDVDAIVNLAGLITVAPGSSWKDFSIANVDVVDKLYSWAEKNNVKQIVQGSTLSVFGRKPSSETISENDIPQPVNNYGLSKLAAEVVLEARSNSNGANTKVTVLRFPSIFGGACDKGIAYEFCKLAFENDEIKVFSNGLRYRNLLYLDDAINAIFQSLKLFSQLSDYEVITVGSRDSLSMMDIAKLIISKTNSASSATPVDIFPTTDWDVHLDLAKLHKMLAMQTMSIEQGIDLYLRSFNN